MALGTEPAAGVGAWPDEEAGVDGWAGTTDCGGVSPGGVWCGRGGTPATVGNGGAA